DRPVEGREDHEHVLDEDRDPAEEEDDHEDLVPGGRPPGQALEQVGEGDQPAEDEDKPRHHAPRRVEEARHEEAGLDGHVAVPDHEVLREEEVRSEEHTSELQSRFDLVCRLLLETPPHPPTSTLFPYTTLFRSAGWAAARSGA